MADLNTYLRSAGQRAATAKRKADEARTPEESTAYMLEAVSAQLDMLIAMGGALVGVERLDD